MGVVVLFVVGVFVAVLPLLAWACLARTRAIGFGVGAVLLAGAGLLVAVQNEWVAAPRPDAHALYTAVTLLVVLFGVALERQQEGRPDTAWGHRRNTAVGILILQSSITLVTSLFFLGLSGEGETPPASAVPDLPPGLTVTARSTGCGSGSCYRVLDIGTTTHLTRTQIIAALDRPVPTCHPNGWFLDRRPLCTEVDTQFPTVRLVISLGSSLD
ncbi:hypothetical protein [Actinacidiphila alni]|uniref:hypothetical protein n=1 Tax=Actinacidiphila alni TaxID=380248 RepID=UPI0034522041